MKHLLLLIFILSLSGCGASMDISNERIKNHKFLSQMYSDDYFPNHLVKKGEDLLLELCAEIEEKKPVEADEVYKLTHATTIKFNELANEFGNSGSEIETAARENIAADIAFILDTYGYSFDIEKAISPREW